MVAIIAFLTSAVGRWVVIGAIAAAVGIGIRQSGINSERRKCEAASQQRAVEIINKDMEIGRLHKERDDAFQAQRTEHERVDREVGEKLKAELAKRPIAAQCGATNDDIKWLR